ncbi:MAG TPA: DUF5926 family protein [Jiangellales bacterium]|nr:DUF5926 family protein [Jiangellales bacterium]
MPPTATRSADVPEVGPRQPCPCGSGKRYKVCHGKAAARVARATARTYVARPFEGLAGEGDLIAMREFVPAATAPLQLVGEHADRTVVAATVLPMALPALARADGQVWLGLQTTQASGDVSSDLAHTLLEALAAEPGTSIAPGLPEGPGPRLQDLVDPDVPLTVTVHDGFDFWTEGEQDVTPEVAASLERASAAVVPTQRLVSVQAAYWARVGDREHLRWVLPYDEEPLLDALARLRSAGQDGLAEGKLLGTFRAHGLLVPVWDLVVGTPVDDLEDPAVEFAERLTAALDETAPLTTDERRARAALANRQVTIR